MCVSQQQSVTCYGAFAELCDSHLDRALSDTYRDECYTVFAAEFIDFLE
jgi:hypothetical protein